MAYFFFKDLVRDTCSSIYKWNDMVSGVCFKRKKKNWEDRWNKIGEMLVIIELGWGINFSLAIYIRKFPQKILKRKINT